MALNVHVQTCRHNVAISSHCYCHISTYCIHARTEGLAWDWVNEKLYWTDRCDKDIEVFDTKTGYRKVLLQTGSSSNPNSIVVDPFTR